MYDVGALNATAPNVDVNGITADLASINKPALNLPEAPTTTVVDIPVAPQVTLPTFAGHLGDTSVGPAPDLVQSFKTEYATARPEIQAFVDSQLQTWMNQYAPGLKESLVKLEAKINADMDSGRALSAEFETALYNRARSRAEQELHKVEGEISRGVAKRGFTLPPAAMSAAKINAHQATADAIATQSTELAIERAKMEIQHVQFVMQLSSNLQQVMQNTAMQYLSTVAKINDQALEVSKQIAAYLNEVYNNTFKKANLTIEVFRAESAVYEVELKSAMARLDEYRLEVEVAKLKKDMESIDIDLYKARIEGENAKIQQYLAMLEAVSKRADMEKMKVELFGEEVKAYVAQLQGKEAEFRAYSAALSGDESKLKAELAKVEVYNKEVEAEAIKQKAELATTEADTNYNRALSDLFSAELSRYKTDVAAEQTRFGASVEGYKAKLATVVETNKAELQAFSTRYDKARLDLEAAKTQYDGDIKQAISFVEQFLAHTKILADTAFKVGDTYGNMAAAALSSQNTMIAQQEQL